MNQTAPPVQRALTVEQKQNGTLAEVVEMLNRADRNQQLLALLGSAEAVETFKTVALHALAGNGAVLKDCTAESILVAIREAATLGLMPTGLLGEGWIIPYKSRARFMPGYRGYLKLIQNSGEVQALDCQVVRAKDEFSGVTLGTNPGIVHRIPRMAKDEDRGDYEGAYAWVRLRSGELVMEWMGTADIEAIRRRSQSSNEGPWVTDWGEMARKTVIRRLVKRLPMSTRDERLMRLQEHEAQVDAEEDARPTISTRAVAAAEAALAANGLPSGAEPQPDPEPAVVAVTDGLCGKLDESPLEVGACTKPAGHTDRHGNEAGTFPA